MKKINCVVCEIRVDVSHPKTKRCKPCRKLTNQSQLKSQFKLSRKLLKFIWSKATSYPKNKRSTYAT